MGIKLMEKKELDRELSGSSLILSSLSHTQQRRQRQRERERGCSLIEVWINTS
jgi:hypothetical protein